ncbi:MAG: BamA/TamA family outer membrane protein [Bacteroidales bacterium]|nr:BamA/TamA family outer membrane protein [Bacteroidales bacterium]
MYLGFVILLFTGCNPARNIPSDQYLLNRNRIKVKEAEVKNEALKPFIRQQPNRRILGLYRFHLQVYQLADRGPENGFKRWIKNAIGEPPVVFDPVLMQSSQRQFELFMQGKGYFNAEIEAEVNTRDRKANVTYHIKGNTTYRVRDFNYNIPDAHLASFILNDTLNALLHPQEQYDADLLENERERITRQLRNQGFFNFSKDFIFFHVDSMVGDHQVDIELHISQPGVMRPQGTDSIPGAIHKRYMVDQVFVYPDFSPFYSGTIPYDTTFFAPSKLGRGPVYQFLHNDPMSIRPRAVAHNILIEPGRFFRGRDVELTYNYLSGLRNFRFINIQFSENLNPHQGMPSDTLGFLDARIQLARSPSNAFTVEAEGLNSSGNLGVAGNVMFTNRNIFGGAERLNIRLKGALEVTGESASQEVINRLPFNTLELGAEVSIDFPKLLAPIPMERLSKNARPRSTLLTGINYRQRPDYTRYIFNVSYGFEWSENIRKRHYLYPIEISSIKVFNDSILQSRIPEGNPLILSRYKDHLTAGIKYSYVFSSQQLGRDADFMYFRGNFESAGNLMQLASSIFDAGINEDGNYTIFNIPFAQYLKGDADWRFYKVFNHRSRLAFRLMAGAGIPYGNSTVMPFVRSFYGGGANSVRAWRIYTLGPGSYRDTLGVRFDRYGDIKLEANIEHRFAIYRFWHAAFFADAGNVWFINENPQFPGGEFSVDDFYKEIAIGAGAGLRLDFDFFVVRVDAAFPVHNPSLDPGNRWISAWPGLKEWNFNLGIGYPF